MTFSRAVSAIVALSMTTTSYAAPIETCAEQWPCLDFTFECLAAPNQTQVCTGDCEYRVCMFLDYGGSCQKTGSVSHTCAKPDGVCTVQPPTGFDNGLSTEITNINNGTSFCQIVPPGGVAEFLIKDGNARDGCGKYESTLGNAASVTCETLGVKSCTGPGNIDKECVWKVTAPKSCGKNGGGGGDPHIKLWNRTRYSYHGECDLVLLQNEDFADGLGMDIHIRTTQKSFYSFIESAAIRIGNDILEVTGTDFWINGVQGSDTDLPTTIAGFPLHYPTYSPSGKTKFYQIDLNNGDNVLIRSYSHFMSVDVLGRSRDFSTAVGLMGDYHSSKTLARDGKTVMHNMDEFGSEWQVHGDEAELFRDMLREPQHPHAACTLPEMTKQSRHLRQESEALFVTAAEKECANKATHDFEFCVHDVLATKDIGMAEAW